MTTYTVAAPAEVMTVTATGEENLVIKMPSGNYMVPIAAFRVDVTPAISMGDIADMSMHRICALIDSQMRRIKQQELDLAAAARAGYVVPTKVAAAPPADKPAREYVPLDNGKKEVVS